MRRLIPTAAVAALAFAFAAPAFASANVEVTVGPELAKKTQSYGAREIEQIRQWLDEAATRAIDRKAGSPVVRADLVLADAVPNRPTFEQLGRSPQLSFLDSVGIGGAKIEGTVTTADGQVHPVRYAFYETSLQNEIGATTWYDAERAFMMVSSRIARGDFPQQTKMLTPTGTGKFGSRFSAVD